MVKRGLKIIGLLLSGPIFAFVVLIAGCSGPWQLFGVWCGHNSPLTLVILSVCGWMATAVAVVIMAGRKVPK